MAAAVLAAPALAAPAGYFQVPGTETTLKIYGFAQADGVYDMDGNYGMDDGISYKDMHHESLSEDNQWHWRAKGRFGFTTTTPSALGDVTMKIEFQAADSGDNKVAMRHCFGTIGNLTVGKTDSIFADWDASPNYMDNDGVLADFYGNSRVNQVSYKYEFTKGLVGQFGIEQDKTGSTDSYFPGAFVAALGYTADWGHVRGAVAFAKNKMLAVAAESPYSYYDDDDDPTTPDAWGQNPDDVVVGREESSKSHVSWGLGANVNFFGGKGNLTAQVFEGVGFYGVDDGDAYYWVEEDEIDVQKVLGWTLGYSHAVTDTVTLAGGIGQCKWKEDKEVFDDTLTINNFFVNCQWQATKTAMFGIEYFYGQAKRSDSYFVKDDGDLTHKAKEQRINVRAKFNMF
jgi:hypothetical protein